MTEPNSSPRRYSKRQQCLAQTEQWECSSLLGPLGGCGVQIIVIMVGEDH